MPRTPAERRAHMQKMNEARLAKQAAARAAAELDNPIAADEVGMSVDDLTTETVTPPKEKPARRGPGRPPRIDPDLAARAAKVGVGKPAPPPKLNPTVRRDLTRHPETGRVVVVRDGITYTRTHSNQGDKFFIAASDVPDGMSYQWIAVTVDGAEQRNSMQGFEMNGWRPVKMHRYPGRYGPALLNGRKNESPIILDGLMLVERPIELTIEAREEELKAAHQLIRTRNEQFAPKLPGALDRDRRGTGLRAKRSIDRMPSDIERPTYQMDVDDGLV